MKNKYIFLLILLIELIFVACHFNERKKQFTIQDNPREGTIYISAEESFKPILQQEKKMYEITFPNTHLNIVYKSYIDCLQDLLNDSTRMIIIDRGLTPEECIYYKNTLSFKPLYDSIALSSISVIVNKNSKDSFFSLSSIKNILNGKIKNREAVIAGKHRSSVLNYLSNLFLQGDISHTVIKSTDNNSELIEYIAKHVNAVGFIDDEWINNYVDSLQHASLPFVKVMAIKDKENKYYYPTPATIYFGQYPFLQPIYYILKENTSGLGTGFVNFMSLERGQLIFQNGLLVPLKMNFTVRRVR